MSDFIFDVETALNSQTYTPTADDTTKNIYGIINNSTISDETYAEYKQIFDNLPTTNIYSSLIQNPHTCAICNSQDSISNITSAIQNQYNNVKKAGTPIPNSSGQTGINPNDNPNTTDGDISQPDQNGIYPGNEGYQPTQTQITILDNWNSTYPSVVETISNISNNVSSYNDYTNKIVSNLPTILGIIQTAMALDNLLNDLANPCLGLSNFLSSLAKAGATLIAEIEAGLAKVLSLIGGALETIMDALATVMGYVEKLLNLMENELKNLIEAMIAGLQYGLANLLSILAGDPCLKSLVSILGTGALLSVI